VRGVRRKYVSGIQTRRLPLPGIFRRRIDFKSCPASTSGDQNLAYVVSRSIYFIEFNLVFIIDVVQIQIFHNAGYMSARDKAQDVRGCLVALTGDGHGITGPENIPGGKDHGRTQRH
jgi:hypothetical protein